MKRRTVGGSMPAGRLRRFSTRCFHLIERRDEVRVVVELRDDARVFVGRIRRDLFEIVQRPQLLLDRRGDEFGDVFGGRAAPLHFDVHHRHVHRRIELRWNPVNGPHTGQNHHDHREIRGYAVLGDLPDHRISLPQARRQAGLHDSCQYRIRA
jgi:hypothetical protein